MPVPNTMIWEHSCMPNALKHLETQIGIRVLLGGDQGSHPSRTG